MNHCSNYHKLVHYEIDDCPLCEEKQNSEQMVERLLNTIDKKEVKIQDQEETIIILNEIIDKQIQEKLKVDEQHS